MCKGWALQVVWRRPNTAGSPGSLTQRGPQGSPRGSQDPIDLAGERECKATAESWPILGLRKEDLGHAGSECQRVVNPQSLIIPEEVCSKQPGSSPRMVNKVSLMNASA
jgi:hypothetical protein